MMVLKAHFTDAEITEFFQNNGFATAAHMRGKWVPGYHNQSEWVETEVPGIVMNGKVYDAEPVFSQVVEARMKKMLAPSNLETQRIIERILKGKP